MRSLASYWRDPDPVRRWAAGQTVRHWSHLPMILSAIAIALITPLPLLLRFVWDWTPEAIMNLYMFLLTIALVSNALGVALSPANRIARLGGPVVLRDLWMVPGGPKEMRRLLFAGSWRGTAAPMLVLLYCIEFQMLGMWMLIGETSGGFSLVEFARSEPSTVALIIFVLVPFPALDHAMNLALAWHLRLRTDRPQLTQAAMLGILIASPALVALLVFSTVLSASFALAAIVAAVLIALLLSAWAFVELYTRPRLYWLGPVAVLLILFAGTPAIFHLLTGYGLSQTVPVGAAAVPLSRQVLCAWMAIAMVLTFKARCAFAAWRGLDGEIDLWLQKTAP